MGLLDDIQSAGRNTGTICGVHRVLTALDKADRADLTTALDDTALTGAQIARALTARGHKIQGDTVMRHRKGECSCGRAR